ncbi:MAG TPA: phage head closure protein [Xanthobacteraceae bacterium]|nr:phage head closure protein [Xanthobacteraceae bacterium]
MTTIGDLNQRLLLEEPVETPDGAGGVVRSYQTVTTLWAALVPVAAENVVIADGGGVTVTHRIVIRHRADVTARHRFRLGARIFQVAALRDEDGRGRFLDVAVEERAD